MTFPICPLYRLAIVDALPAKCPYRAADVAAELKRRQDVSWAALQDKDGDQYAARVLLRKSDMCTRCRLHEHVHVRWLRKLGKY